ncbi:SOR/SNZ family protein [Candida albicans]|uniref:SOR/SNZ family protein n=1 Tax=Candida albicans TaxID=5476 RepID=A0A8H6C2T3_CANAX|nr:SOR/SNZ family protein [Candida albicans]
MSDFKVKAGLAQMLKGGVIMDVVNADQAKIAEAAGACAVMALERIPAEMRKSNQVCRMSDPKMIKDIMETVKIPVMAKCRIGHFTESQILEALGVDYIDESEVLTPADTVYHIDKTKFKVPFVCGARNLGEALRRINEGAAMIRCKEKKLPVVLFCAGGVSTPADAALLMQLGCDGVFVGSGIFKSKNPEKLAKAIVNATTHYNDPVKLLQYSTDLGELMGGIAIDSIKEEEKLEKRGW